ncbi:flagellin lysine-N-methylase [Cohnella mopanensis]|uniref:flagellin lysine-N-methylase n=1 Tax=Cohnella mopanensis TaxID=2911966 RepID=UPI001EF999AA|nr:flagellin lysine-N-methylase [Cohnella mopanensis]
MKKGFQVMTPQYMRQFQCTGSACEDTCCGGWAISVEKEAYKRYQKVKDKELQMSIKENIIRVKKDATEYYYAVMKQNEEGYCNFLTVEKLCSLQSKLGEAALCQTCSEYPRVYNQVDGRIEISSKLSCPETARLALLNPNPMEFDVVEMDLDRGTLASNIVNTNKGELSSAFWDIRIFVISLIQNRSYLLKERLMILGLFCSKLDELIGHGNFSSIGPLIQQFNFQIEQRLFHNVLNIQSDSVHVSIKLLKEMTEYRSRSKMFHARYNTIFEQTFEGLNLHNGTEEEIVGLYKDGLGNVYEPFLESHGYIMENFVVNYVFEGMFLYEKEKTALQQYIRLISIYSTIKFHMVGVGKYNGNMTPENALVIIQSYSRTTEHNRKFLNWLVDRLEKTEMNLVALMAIMIMN